MSRIIYFHNKPWGQIYDDGYVYKNGTRIGRLKKDGSFVRIYNEGLTHKGFINKDGYIFDANNTRIGKITRDGYIYDEKFNRLGSISPPSGISIIGDSVPELEPFGILFGGFGVAIVLFIITYLMDTFFALKVFFVSPFSIISVLLAIIVAFISKMSKFESVFADILTSNIIFYISWALIYLCIMDNMHPPLYTIIVMLSCGIVFVPIMFWISKLTQKIFIKQQNKDVDLFFVLLLFSFVFLIYGFSSHKGILFPKTPKGPVSIFDDPQPFNDNKENDTPANRIIDGYNKAYKEIEEEKDDKVFSYNDNEIHFNSNDNVSIARKLNYNSTILNKTFNFVDLYYDLGELKLINCVNDNESYAFLIKDNSIFRLVKNYDKHFDLTDEESQKYDSLLQWGQSEIFTMASDISSHKKEDIISLQKEIDSNMDDYVSRTFIEDEDKTKYSIPISGYDDPNDDLAIHHKQLVKVVDKSFTSDDDFNERKAVAYYDGEEGEEELILVHDFAGKWYYFENQHCFSCTDEKGNELDNKLVFRNSETGKDIYNAFH